MAALAVLAVDRAAIADGPQPAEIALARRLFADARTAEDAKDWPTAAAKLREAISIKETPGLRFHLAYCEEQQGSLVEALVDYERADDLSADMNEEFRAQIPARRTALQKRIPTATLLFGGETSNARLTVDGHPFPPASLGKPIPLNPGKHVFVVSSTGFARFTTELSLNEGDAVVTNVVLTPDANAPPVPASRDASASRASGNAAPGGGSRVRTYVLVGEAAIAIGALGVGVGFTLQAAADDERASSDKARLPGPTACTMPQGNQTLCDDLADAREDARRERSIARVGFIGAGVGAAAFAGTLILWPSVPPQTALRPWFGSGVAGLSVTGRF